MSHTKKIIIGMCILLVSAVGAMTYVKLRNDQSSLEATNQPVSERYDDRDTGLDLIQKAFDEGKLDYDTALLYKVKFLFNDSTLPREYFTKNAPFEDGSVFTEMKANWKTLSQETQEALEPYFRRPDDVESFISKKLNGEETDKTSSFRFIQAVQARDRPFSYKSEDVLTTADGKIRVWYLEKKEMVNDEESVTKLYYETAKQIVANLNTDGAYPQFVGLLGKVPPDDGAFGGDNKTDVYIVPSGYSLLQNTDGSTSLGVNAPDNGSGYSSFILIRDNLTADALKTTTVHELFHAFQRAFPWCWQTKKDLWWIEGTATWSEDFIYPKINSEQGYVGSFIPKPDSGLVSSGDNFEYGAYVFPFYLSNTYDRGVVTKIFEGCGQGVSSVKSADSNIDGGFKKNWKEFTLWNFNQQPVEYYKQKDQSRKFTKHSSESGGNAENNFIASLGEMSYQTKVLDPLTSQVLTFSIDEQQGQGIRKVVFKDLKALTGKTDKVAIKAVVYPKSGEPYTEDWTDQERRGFCLDKRNEDFDKIVLIVSNADIKDKLGVADIKVKSTDSCSEIGQEEAMSSKPIFGVDPNYSGTVKYRAEGELIKDSVPAGAKYPYLGKWRVKVDYLEHWPGQRVYNISQTAMDFAYNHFVEFDLSVESVLKDGTFVGTTKEGKFETPGWTIHNEISGQDTTVPQNKTMWDVPQKGVISDMTESGCKISFPDFVLYNSGGYRDLPHPIVFQIRTD
ncbi:MAG: hypothetical protein RDU25_02680 [Patescibacteria group bacterium]|nr:hypothetical protein [Patescibacteria group bacterium]